jgi:hypothetical protein
VADTLVKPNETGLPAVDVGQLPAKRTSQRVQRKIVGPLDLDRSARKLIAQPSLTTKSGLEIELAEVNRAWRRYRSIKDRDAVYIYLASVFGIVMRWRRLNCALKQSRAALRIRPNPPQMKAEPFAMVIFCPSDPNIADAKTRSKWSRVLRYAARAKPPGQRLINFVKSNGGLNECACRFARSGRPRKCEVVCLIAEGLGADGMKTRITSTGGRYGFARRSSWHAEWASRTIWRREPGRHVAADHGATRVDCLQSH